MARRQKKAAKEMETAGMMRWLLTYADMITLLLAMFILLYAISKVNQEKYKQAMEAGAEAFNQKVKKVVEANKSPVDDPYNKLESSLKDVYEVMKRILEEGKLQDQIQLEIEERGLRISFMTDGVFFDIGKADLKTDLENVLIAMVPVLTQITNSIRVEGHTCNIPIDTFEFPSNWELSTRRATNVLRFIIEGGVPATKMAAAGYADTRPVVPNDSDSNRAKNRRVDIIVLRTTASQLEPKASKNASSEAVAEAGEGEKATTPEAPGAAVEPAAAAAPSADSAAAGAVAQQPPAATEGASAPAPLPASQ
jgi:chemotaxis protein MotB